MNKTLEKVLAYIRAAIAAHPIKEEGKTYNPTVYYQNGNDGTDFDWSCNDRTCEFFVFYEGGEDALGYVKAYVTKDGCIEGYVWDTERYSDGVRLPSVSLVGDDEDCWEWDREEKAQGRARRFRNWLMSERDKSGVYDKPIASI